MSDFQVAIPSYRRPVTLASKTLPLLLRGGVPPDVITVFVADQAEHDLYRRSLPRNAYRDIVIGAPGMGTIRNFINRAYPSGVQLLQIDDDVDSLDTVGESGDLEPVRDLPALFRRGFAEMHAAGATLWGVYPVYNAFFMKGDAVTTDLRYVVGACFGVLNEHAHHCQVSLDDKEDFERTILHYLHSDAVVRLNDVCIKTRYYKEPGGMQVTRTEERVNASAHLLAQKFPSLCKINTSKANRMTELRLRDTRKKATR